MPTSPTPCLFVVPAAAAPAPAAAPVAVAPVAATSRLLAPTKVSQGRARPRSASPAVSSARGRVLVGGGCGAATAIGSEGIVEMVERVFVFLVSFVSYLVCVVVVVSAVVEVVGDAVVVVMVVGWCCLGCC